MDPLRQLTTAGVSIWLDDLSRHRLVGGSLALLVRDERVSGITTNPTIFQKAIAAGAEDYRAQIADLRARGVEVGEAMRALTTFDVRAAADLLRPVFDATDGIDGRVSIEVDPRLADDVDRTVAEARALWWLVDRPNAYVKIPATEAGIPAIAHCLAEGINVNVTLIFGLDRYRQVIDAFLDGMERLRVAGGDLRTVTSVASFFVSRVDTEVDARLDKIGTTEAAGLRGKAAVANARLAYGMFEDSLDTPRWHALAAAGARPQRPLWASTSTKDPAYDDTMYVTSLVAPNTVNTMPEPTLRAVADHGVIPTDSIRPFQAEARRVLDRLAELGIDYDDVITTLEREGVEKFSASWDELTTTLVGALTA
jgi:transaldolase